MGKNGEPLVLVVCVGSFALLLLAEQKSGGQQFCQFSSLSGTDVAGGGIGYGVAPAIFLDVFGLFQFVWVVAPGGYLDQKLESGKSYFRVPACRKTGPFGSIDVVQFFVVLGGIAQPF